MGTATRWIAVAGPGTAAARAAARGSIPAGRELGTGPRGCGSAPPPAPRQRQDGRAGREPEQHTGWRAAGAAATTHAVVADHLRGRGLGRSAGRTGVHLERTDVRRALVVASVAHADGEQE